jgi:DNA polymerase III epsilon subunit-like protein
MREVVFDTETTGLNPREGDRIVEVGCIELVNYLPTGREFQIYINPGAAGFGSHGAHHGHHQRDAARQEAVRAS